MILHVGTRALSSWSLRPYLALAHTDAVFEVHTVFLDLPTSAADIAAVSPTGRVPVLDHDGLKVCDSLAICEYAAELHPEAQLWPVDRAARARARSISAEMHSSFAALRREMPCHMLEDRRGRSFTPDAHADVRRICAIWREALAASGGPFLFGEFSIADAMFAPVTTRFTTYGVDVDATSTAYVATIAALPTMRRWLADAVIELADTRR